jgi:hypothetical protein
LLTPVIVGLAGLNSPVPEPISIAPTVATAVLTAPPEANAPLIVKLPSPEGVCEAHIPLSSADVPTSIAPAVAASTAI